VGVAHLIIILFKNYFLNKIPFEDNAGDFFFHVLKKVRKKGMNMMIKGKVPPLLNCRN